MPEKTPISALAKDSSYGTKHGGTNWGQYLLWFIIIAVIAYLIMYALKPTWIQKTGANGQPTGEVDGGKTLIAALIAALVVTLIVWLVRSCGK